MQFKLGSLVVAAIFGLRKLNADFAKIMLA